MSRTLSEHEARLLSALAAAGQRIFTIADARAALNGDSAGVRKLLHRLATKHWLERLERGKYRILPLEAGPQAEWAEHEYLLAATLVTPYYLAYATALSYYGYSERLSDTVWIATTRRKRPVFIEGTVYHFVTLSQRKFFGATAEELLDRQIQIAEREKAIADGFDHPEYCGGILEPAKGLWFGQEELDLTKLAAYTQRLGNRTAMRRLGFWMERLELGGQSHWPELAGPDNRNYALLDPQGPKHGPRDARWRLIVNVPERQLLEWQEH